MNSRMLWAGLCALGLLGLAIPYATVAATKRPVVIKTRNDPFRSTKVPWEKISSWAAQTGNMAKTLDRIAASTVDLGLIAVFNKSGEYWTAKEIQFAKQNKWLVAYMSVGQVSVHDWFWQEGWTTGNPKWIHAPSKVYKGSFDVLFDSPEWLGILKQSIDKILAQGFDGVSLDILDVYWHPTYPGGASKTNMAKAVKLTCELYKYAKAKLPSFKMVVNNATNLVADFPAYRGCIHATIGESVWYYSTNKPRPPEYTRYQIEQLNINVRYGKKVLIVDKATDPVLMNTVYRESFKRKYIPYVSNGGVDLPFPLRPREK